MNWPALREWAIARSTETSTWVGLLTTAGTVSVRLALPADTALTIAGFLALLGGGVLVATKEQSPPCMTPPTPPAPPPTASTPS
jgi:hypothetical protein